MIMNEERKRDLMKVVREIIKNHTLEEKYMIQKQILENIIVEAKYSQELDTDFPLDESWNIGIEEENQRRATVKNQIELDYLNHFLNLDWHTKQRYIHQHLENESTYLFLLTFMEVLEKKLGGRSKISSSDMLYEKEISSLLENLAEAEYDKALEATVSDVKLFFAYKIYQNVIERLEEEDRLQDQYTSLIDLESDFYQDDGYEYTARCPACEEAPCMCSDPF